MAARIGIVGATGYAGAELVRLLSDHPRVEIAAVTSGRKAGSPLRTECPWLETELTLEAFDPSRRDLDVVFLCQEVGFAREVAAELLDQKIRVIDLSADFRLKDAEAHREAYGSDQPALTARALYGLPELADHDAYEGVGLIANPGCHPTVAGLAIAPLARAGLIAGTPVIDSLSGVSGAGRARSETAYTFSELDGAFSAYKPVGHRHAREIEQVVGMPVRFTPHLIPVARGMEAACHVPLVPGPGLPQLQELYREFYKFERFVRIVDAPPSTKAVRGSNRCDLHVAFDERVGMAVVLGAIDNLMKGASGQAVQNLNLMMGWDEAEGLPGSGLWP